MLLLLALNAPDIDNIARLGGDLAFLKQHAGYTHSVLALPLMAAVCVVVTAAIFRQRLLWFRAWSLCSLGVGVHLLLDWITSYGLRPLLPLSSAWQHLDVSGQLDPFLLTVLGIAAVWPHFSKLVSAEIGGRGTGGRGSAIAGLIVLVLFEVTRTGLHQQAMGQIEARLFDGAAPLRFAAIPDAINPLRWTGIVETANTFRTLPINAAKSFDSEGGVDYFKAAVTPSIRRAKSTEAVRYFEYFARFPVWSVVPVLLASGEGNRVELADLRFGEPSGDAPASFTLEDSAGHLLRSWLTLHANQASRP